MAWRGLPRAREPKPLARRLETRCRRIVLPPDARSASRRGHDSRAPPAPSPVGGEPELFLLRAELVHETRLSSSAARGLVSGEDGVAMRCRSLIPNRASRPKARTSGARRRARRRGPCGASGRCRRGGGARPGRGGGRPAAPEMRCAASRTACSAPCAIRCQAAVAEAPERGGGGDEGGVVGVG